MSLVSERQNQIMWETNFKENGFVNKAIWISKKIAGNFTVGFVSGIVSTIFWKTYCRILTSCEVTSPSLLLMFGSMVFYNTFEERRSVYKTYLICKKYFNRNYNKDFIKLAKNEIRNELMDQMGQQWLKIKSFTLEEGVQYFAEICLTDNGICDGEVLSFLNIINNSKFASLKDSDLEDRIKPIDSIKYQVRRELKIEVFKEYCFFYLDDPFYDYCKKYDPYKIFENYRIYHRPAGKQAINLIFRDIQQHALENLKNSDYVLMGRIAYCGKGVVSHCIAIQLNFDHYRYHDDFISSFKSIEELLGNLYHLSNNYFNIYNEIEVRLWKLPYK